MNKVVTTAVTREEISTGQTAVKIARRSFDIYYITARAGALNGFDELADFVRRCKAKIVTQDIFGSCDLYESGIRSLTNAFGSIEWPVTWIEGSNYNGHRFCGTQLYVVSRTAVKPVRISERAVGGVYEDDDAVYCLLGDILPPDPLLSRQKQAAETLSQIESALESAGMDFEDVIRTWFYLDDIQSWYNEFNAVRNEFFTRKGILNGVVPASTGIGVSNPAGTAVVADALAIKPKTDKVSIKPIPSPLQCPAVDYGSSFNRAVEVTLPDIRRLYISGTASIDLDGKTAHIGDTEGQVGLTMEVVGAILKSRGMDWPDVNRAIAYFKHCEDIPVLDDYCRRHSLADLPVAISHADICRDDLLFEIEVDAAQPADALI